MNQSNGDTTFSAGDPAPNPFLGTGAIDAGAMPTIPGFDLSAAKKSPVNVHSVMTLGILVIAGVAIWGMRSIGLRGLQAAPAGADQAMALDPATRPAIMTIEDQRLLTDLNASRTAHQVPGEDLQKNPFALSAAAKPRPRVTNNGPAVNMTTAEVIAAARQQELLNALSEFKLQGVMGGASAVARINGKPYRVGDTLGEKPKPGDNRQFLDFKVTAIEGREVTVSLEGFNFILSMDAQ